MILIEKTLKELGIDVNKLTKGSGKRVIVVCSSCQKERTRQYRNCSKLNLCKTCNGKVAGTLIGNTYGKAQKQQGKCMSCNKTIASLLKWCKKDECQKEKRKHLSNIRSGVNNPAWTGKHICTCGSKKSHGAKLCRKCSFASGDRSGKNNGRYISENRQEHLIKVKAAKKMRGMLGNLKRNLGIKKNTNTEKTLGYTFDEFRNRIESTFTNSMTWDNMGEVWHIDHIVPVDWFVKANILDPQKINKLENLRAFNAKDNLYKSNKITKEAILLIKKWNY